MPLTKAVFCGNLDVVRFLLENGYVPEPGSFLLHHLARNSVLADRIEIARLLLQCCDVNEADESGNTGVAARGKGNACAKQHDQRQSQRCDFLEHFLFLQKNFYFRSQGFVKPYPKTQNRVGEKLFPTKTKTDPHVHTIQQCKSNSRLLARR